MILKLIKRIKNLLLVAVGYVYSLFFGRADKKIKAPQNILIIQLAKLGDMVCTTPMFKAVKEKYPQSYLTVIGNKVNEELLAGNQDIDEYISFDGGLLKLIKIIKKIKPDFACTTAPGLLTLLGMYLAGVKTIVAPKVIGGFSPYATRPYNWLSNLVMTIDHKMGHYAPGQYLKLLEPIDIFSQNTKKYLFFSKSAARKVKSVLSDGLNIGVAPGVANKIKLWPAEKFSRLMNKIISKHHVRFIITGTAEDKKIIDQVVAGLDSKVDFVNTSGEYNLDELKALIAFLDMFIAVDTGPIYMAEALGTPTIDIIGPMDEKEQPPRSEKNLIVKAKRKKPELHIMNARVYNKKEARRQINAISVAMVLKAFNQLLAKIK